MVSRPLIAHIIYRFGTGGLENGLVNLINGLPESKYRHAIICLTESTSFSRRLQRSDVEIVELHKRPGKDLKIYFRLWSVLSRLKPQLVHTRNIATLDAQFIAFLAGITHRLHGEHGRDIYDLDGSNLKYKRLRRLLNPLITAWIPMSQDLAYWLEQDVGIQNNKIRQIYNGVDTQRFFPLGSSCPAFPIAGFRRPGRFLVGTVGRMEPVKDPLNLIKAFLNLWRSSARAREHLRLACIGGGSLHAQARAMVEDAGATDSVWLPGDRDDIAELLRHFDLFVLPSLAEGISNTILEAMASGLPVLATRVGGNPELVHGDTGTLVATGDSERLAEQIVMYSETPHLCTKHGKAALVRISDQFSLDNMIQSYQKLYDTCLAIPSSGGSGENTPPYNISPL